MLVRISVPDLTPAFVVRTIARANRWFLVTVFMLCLACVCVSIAAEAPGIAQIAGCFLVHSLGGLLGSFVVHELAHAALLRRMSGLHLIEVVTTFFRFTFAPKGSLVGWKIALIGIAGPITACAMGVALNAVLPASGLHWWYLGHSVFLLPVFGDGKSVLVGLRTWSRLVAL